ncbi:hypothetical protein ROA7745_03231 [Roseovarius aestuarii]|uniref:Uncharacterized protein n=1 Tax=Roseovarius aestuarii TaxID=475083 RepID=A0A1X7BV68_9RHOB|nr:hypothetical protein [Roseovarius aestuarii]SMC13385.1 hypothetical protein ROA7745_03231 [Roseovarius aestuarii]
MADPAGPRASGVSEAGDGHICDRGWCIGMEGSGSLHHNVSGVFSKPPCGGVCRIFVDQAVMRGKGHWVAGTAMDGQVSR